ncbi:MAG: hypothetical protein J6J17_01615, partial [Bacilli bacterium]|nr:hypothetical protein [Bacilli bacterium]
ILKLDNVNGLDISIPILCVLNLVIVLITSKYKNNFSNSLISFISIILFIMSTFLCAYSSYYNSYDFNMIISTLTCILHIITILIFMKFNTKNGLKYVYPYVTYLLAYVLISSFINKGENIYVFISSLSAIVLYFIFSLYNSKTIKITSFILMLFGIFTSILYNTISNKTIFIISILLLLVSLFEIKINNEGFEKKTCKILLPIITLMSIASLSRIFIDIEYSVIYIIASILCYSIYTILFYKFNNKKLSFIFECFSYIYLGLSSILIIFTNVRSLIFIINEIVWIYYFISRMFINKEIAKNIFLLIISILNLFICSIKFNMPLYYSILFISVIFTLLDILSIKLKIKSESVYFYIAIISIIISIMFDFIQYSILSICINTLVYCMIYYILVRKKVPFIIKYIYTIFGFCLISKLFNYFIDQNVIANIITLIVFVIIIISMFLLRVDTDNKVLSYTPLIVFPYSYIVNNIEIFSLYKTEAIVILLVSLILIFMEKVFIFKYENDRTLLEIILISILHIFTIYTNIIFNILLSIFYIFFGTYKKKDSFIILGIVLLILSIFINLFKIIDNLSITYILLGIGIILVTYVFIVEAKKNNKK